MVIKILSLVGLAALLATTTSLAADSNLRREYSRNAFPFGNDIAHILYRARASSEWLAPALEQLALATNSTLYGISDGRPRSHGPGLAEVSNALFNSPNEDAALASLQPLLRRLRWGNVKSWLRGISKRHLYRDISTACETDLNLILSRLDNETDMLGNTTDGLWASRFVDAMGKPQHNVLDGNTFWYGSHEECASITRDLVSDGSGALRAQVPTGSHYFAGHYCLADIGTPVRVTQQMLLHGRPPGIHWGFCLPERCSTDDFKMLWHNVLEKLTTDAAAAEKTSERFQKIFDIDKSEEEEREGVTEYDDDDWRVKRNARKDRRHKPVMIDVEPAKPLLAVNWAKCDPVGDESDYDAPAIAVLCLLAFFAVLAFLGTALEVYLLSSSSSAMRSGFGVNKPVHDANAADNAPLLSHPGDSIGAAAELSTPPPGDHPSGSDRTPHGKLAALGMPLWMRILTTFSLLNGGRKILDAFTDSSAAKTTSADGIAAPADGSRRATIATVHGIRFLSMVWVILGHSYAHMGTMLSNPRVMPDVAKQFWFQIVMNTSLSVDTFLLLSGMLVTYLFVTEWEKRGRRMPAWSDWVRFYVHRYLRLTPVYMLVLGITAGLLPLFMWGPSSYMVDAWMPNRCANSWWTNALYINNILMFSEQCMSWTWYLAIDMQLYVITPLVLYPLIKFGTRTAVAILGVLMLAHLITTALITGLNDMPAHFATKQTLLEPFTLHKYFDLYYVKTWCRAGPYFIGMLLGLILVKHKQQQKKPDSRNVAVGDDVDTAEVDAASMKKRWLVVGGWLMAAQCLLVPVYALWPTYLREEDFSLIVSTLYNTLARNVWAVGVAWVLYMCETGRGGPINALLSWSALVPLSRLTYCAYLIHMPIILAVLGNTTQQMPFSHLTCLVYFAGFFVVTYLCAFVLCIMLEAPLLGLEKILYSSGRFVSAKTSAAAAGVGAGGSRRAAGGRGAGVRTPSPTFGDRDERQQ